MALIKAKLSSLADKLYGTGQLKERNQAKSKSKVGKVYKPKKK